MGLSVLLLKDRDRGAVFAKPLGHNAIVENTCALEQADEDSAENG
jgi:hypothetical protein